MKKRILSGIMTLAMLLLVPIFTGCNNSNPELSISQSFKLYYVVGEVLDISGGIVKYTDGQGTEKFIDVTNDMISGFSTNNEGSYKLIITYEGEQLMLTYKVFKLSLTNNAWYKSATQFNGEYLYVRFNLNNKTMNAVSDINSDARDVSYSQTVDANGIKLTVGGSEYGTSYSMIISNIGDNTFSLTNTSIHSGQETTFTSSFSLYS